MSIRTAIEINHDFHQTEEFLCDLMWALYRGTEAEWTELARVYGVERVYRCHHSDDRLEAHKAQRHPANFRRAP